MTRQFRCMVTVKCVTYYFDFSNDHMSSSYDYDTPITTILHIGNIERNYANKQIVSI